MNRRVTRYAPYLWLAYLSALVFQPAFDPDAGPWDWVAVALMIAVFVPLYRSGLGERDPRRLVFLLAGMAGLGVLGTLVNAGAGVFLVYAAAFAGRLTPISRATAAVAGLAGMTGVLFVVSPVPVPWRLVSVLPVLVFVVVVGAAGILDGERERAQARLRRADEEIERLATIAERERIARDLHDLLGHTLSVIVLRSEVASRLLPVDPERAEEEVRDVERTARTALTEVRAAVAGYRARGLGAELASAREALSAADIDVQASIDLPALPAQHESALALALREAVTNVVRHADADTVTIRSEAARDRVVLEVTDDGRGGSAPDGSGLSGMRERVAALGGHVIRADGAGAPGRVGTLLRVTLPRPPLAEPSSPGSP